MYILRRFKRIFRRMASFVKWYLRLCGQAMIWFNQVFRNVKWLGDQELFSTPDSCQFGRNISISFLNENFLFEDLKCTFFFRRIPCICVFFLLFAIWMRVPDQWIYILESVSVWWWWIIASLDLVRCVRFSSVLSTETWARNSISWTVLAND